MNEPLPGEVNVISSLNYLMSGSSCSVHLSNVAGRSNVFLFSAPA